uniref:Saposin B-type domain-containing protein n=1 Tax=Rhabditophanes sp. KR3021 TaxID=114890 RepID=A0AC35U3K6_9BILA
MKFFIVLLIALMAFAGVAKANIICNLCLDFVKDMEVAVENDEPDLEKKADEICNKLTDDNSLLDPLCKQLVDTEIDTIIKGIENNDPPEVICKRINFC